MIDKSEAIHVTTLRYESNVAVAGLIWNLGETEAIDRIFKHFELPVHNDILDKFFNIEITNEKNKKRWLGTKSALYQARKKNQQQYKTSTQWREKYNKAFQTVTNQIYLTADEAADKMMWEDKRKLIEIQMQKDKEEEKQQKAKERKEQTKLKRQAAKENNNQPDS